MNIGLEPLHVAACVLYGVGANFQVKLGRGRTIAARAAVGAVLISSGALEVSTETMPILLAAGGALCSGVVKQIQGRLNRLFSLEVLALLISALFAVAFMKLGPDTPDGVSMVVLVSVVSLPSWLLERSAVGREGISKHPTFYRRESISIHLMSISLAAMTMLTLGRLRWGSYVLLLLVLVVLRSEFNRLAEAETTYTQSVAALGRLIEKAGYVTIGYHQTVGHVLKLLVDELSLSREIALQLSLGALVYSTGWVSLGDPEDLANFPRDQIREAGVGALRSAPPPGLRATSGRRTQEVVAELIPLVSDFVRYGELPRGSDQVPVDRGDPAASAARILADSLK